MKIQAFSIIKQDWETIAEVFPPVSQKLAEQFAQKFQKSVSGYADLRIIDEKNEQIWELADEYWPV